METVGVMLEPAATGVPGSRVLADDRALGIGVRLPIRGRPEDEAGVLGDGPGPVDGDPDEVRRDDLAGGGRLGAPLAEGDGGDRDRDDHEGGDDHDADLRARPAGFGSVAGRGPWGGPGTRRDVLVGGGHRGDGGRDRTCGVVHDRPGSVATVRGPRRGGRIDRIGQRLTNAVGRREMAQPERPHEVAQGPGRSGDHERRPGLAELALDGPDGIGRGEVEVHDRVGVEDDRRQRLPARRELADPVAERRRRREEQRPGEPDDEDAGGPSRGRAALDVGEVVAVEAPEFGDVRLGGTPEDVERRHQGCHPDPDERAVQDDAGGGDDRDGPSLGWIRQIRAISPGLDEVQGAGQHDGAEGGDREQRQRPGQEQQDDRHAPGGDDARALGL